MPDLIGQQLGQYQITGLLGTGGMASVYRARQVSMNRDVALKVIESEASKGGEFIKRFEREVQTVAGISHAHILKVFDYGQHDGMVYLVMELLTGGTLADVIARGPMPLPQISRLLDQIASALDYAHRRGIVHRDLKPHNVMLDDDGNAFLTDFGIAKIMSGTQAGTMTQAGAIMGTPAYMAPEQWRSEPVDARTDIYALGVMVYEMLTGKLPFEADTAFGYMHKHLNEPPPLRNLLDRFPAGLEKVLSRALAKNPSERFSSASDMVAEFKEAIEGRDSQDADGDTPPVVLIEIPVEDAPPIAPVTAPAPARAASVAPTMPPKPTGPLGGTQTGTSKAVPATTERQSPRTLLLVGVAAVVVIGLAAVLLLSRGGDGGGSGGAGAATGTQTQSQAVALGETATQVATEASESSATPTERRPSITPTTPVPTHTATREASATRITPTDEGAPMTRAAGTLGARQTGTAQAVAAFTKTFTPTFTASATDTATATPTLTATLTATFTATSTFTPTFTFTPSATATATATLPPCTVTAPTRTTSIFLGPSARRTNLGYMPFNTPVLVLDQATDADGNAWWRVDVASAGAPQVWVRQDGVTASESCAVLFAAGVRAATPTPAPGAVCTASAPTRTTSVYLGPNTRRTNLGYMPLNLPVPVLAQAVDADGNAWWRVALPDRGNTEAWVLQSTVRTAGPCAQVPNPSPTPGS